MRNTWFVDIDWTLVKHKTNVELDDQLEFISNVKNIFAGFTSQGSPMLHHDQQSSKITDIELLDEELLPGVKEFWNRIPEKDIIILTTAREERHRWLTQQMLNIFNLRYDQMIMAIGSGKRFLINDREESERLDTDLYGSQPLHLNRKDKAIALNVGRNIGLPNGNWIFTYTT